MGDERVLGHAVDATPDLSGRLASGISQASEKPCDVIPSAVLLLVDMLAKAMHTVSSTIAAGPSRSSRLADSSSVTVGGVLVMASAYSSTFRSSGVNSADSRPRRTGLALALFSLWVSDRK